MLSLTIRTRAAALIAFSTVALTSAGCTNDKALTGGTIATGTFLQIARSGRPLVIELYSPWAHHDSLLRSGPAADPTQLFADIGTFVSGTAGRSAAITTFLQDLFAGQPQIPPAQFPTESNVLVADLAQMTPATYLGVELGDRLTASGQVNPHPTASFGGRGLPDDVAAITLGLTFGNLVPAITNIPDDGREKDGRNGTPNLANDNVTSLTPPKKHYQIGYPYVFLQNPYVGQPI
ncbi:MAG: DUF4331 family protein [Candidatus Eremiobacteraeota bacterium]|nr:DUF4331 family protein [Candidatus Eremiobacteraeota bacterium]